MEMVHHSDTTLAGGRWELRTRQFVSLNEKIFKVIKIQSIVNYWSQWKIAATVQVLHLLSKCINALNTRGCS